MQLSPQNDIHQRPVASLGQEDGPGRVGTPVGWLWGVSCWGQQEEGEQRAGHDRGCVPGAGHTTQLSLPQCASSPGHLQGAVFPPLEDIAKTSCLQSAGRGREGRESGLASSLPPSSLSLLSNLFCTSLLAVGREPRGAKPRLWPKARARGRVWVCNLRVIGPCPESDPWRCSLGLVVTTSLQTGREKPQKTH